MIFEGRYISVTTDYILQLLRRIAALFSAEVAKISAHLFWLKKLVHLFRQKQCFNLLLLTNEGCFTLLIYSFCFSLVAVEEMLEGIIRTAGEEGLNSLRDEARIIASSLSMEGEFAKLNKIVSALLRSRTAAGLTSPAALARAAGEPYDVDRIALFEGLFQKLQNGAFPSFPDANNSGKDFENLPFLKLISPIILKAPSLKYWMAMAVLPDC